MLARSVSRGEIIPFLGGTFKDLLLTHTWWDSSSQRTSPGGRNKPWGRRSSSSKDLYSPGVAGTGSSFWGQHWSKGGGEGAAPAEGIGTGFRPPSSLGKEGVSLWHDVTSPSAPQKFYLSKSSSSGEKITEAQYVVQQRIPHWPEICASSPSCYKELQTYVFSRSFFFFPVLTSFLVSSYIFDLFTALLQWCTSDCSTVVH